MPLKKALLICSLMQLVIGKSMSLIFSKLHKDHVTAEVVEDEITLQAIIPPSGVSACPGQDVTINCTVVRTGGVLIPALQWRYRGDNIIFNTASDSSVYYTAVFHAVGQTVMSNATINSVQISHNDTIITCSSPASIEHSKTIKIAGTALSNSC